VNVEAAWLSKEFAAPVFKEQVEDRIDVAIETRPRVTGQ